MIDVVCFCGCRYSFTGDGGACPNCGEPVSLGVAAAENARESDAQLEQLVTRAASQLAEEQRAA